MRFCSCVAPLFALCGSVRKTCISKSHSGHNNCLRAQTCSNNYDIHVLGRYFFPSLAHSRWLCVCVCVCISLWFLFFFISISWFIFYDSINSTMNAPHLLKYLKFILVSQTQSLFVFFSEAIFTLLTFTYLHTHRVENEWVRFLFHF